MKTIKFAGLGFSLYETLFSIFTSPAASWGLLAGSREGGFILLEVMLNLLEPCYCYTLTPVQPGNNTRRPGQECDKRWSVSVTGSVCHTVTISVSHCHNLYWLPREQECSDLTPRTIQQYLALVKLRLTPPPPPTLIKLKDCVNVFQFFTPRLEALRMSGADCEEKCF